MSRAVLFCQCFLGFTLVGATNPWEMPFQDASDVTWAHAVNSKASLQKELSGDVLFLEADISVGHVSGEEEKEAIPIMAHPPAVISDISFDNWLLEVVSSKKRKGIKLDFKVIEAVEPALKSLRKMRVENLPVWLNADILPGPVNAPRLPVNATEFLSLCRQYFPTSTLSLGWTTYWDPTLPVQSWQYNWKNVRQMADTLHCAGIDQPVTFPVRAVFVKRSIPQLSWLVSVVPSSSLTVWNTQVDFVSVEDLLDLRAIVPRSLVYYDLLHLTDKFTARKNDVREKPPSSIVGFHVVKSLPLQDSKCSPDVYMSPTSVMFRTKDRLAILTKPFSWPKDTPLNIDGKLELFGNDGENMTKEGTLTLVIADAHQFSPDIFTTEETLVREDEDFWRNLNESTLHRIATKESPTCLKFEMATCDGRYCFRVLDCEGTQVKEGRWMVLQEKTEEIHSEHVVFACLVSGQLDGVVYDIQVNETKHVVADATRTSNLGVLLFIFVVTLAFLGSRLLSGGNRT